MATKVSRVRKNLDESAITAGRSYRHQRHITGHDTPFAPCQRISSFVFNVVCTQGIRRRMVFNPEVADGIRCQQTALKATGQYPHVHPQIQLHARMYPKAFTRTTYHHVHA